MLQVSESKQVLDRAARSSQHVARVIEQYERDNALFENEGYDPVGTYPADELDLYREHLVSREVFDDLRAIEDLMPGLSAILDVAEETLADRWVGDDFARRVDRAMEARKYGR